MNFAKFIILLLLFISSNKIFYAQQFARLEADITIKEKDRFGNEKLLVGRVFYDINYRQIVYDITFPEKELLIINDTAITTLVNDVIQNSKPANQLVDFSIFSLALNNDLEYFGLDKTPFAISNVELEEGMTISTWLPKPGYQQNIGKMLLSQKDNRIFGIVSFDRKDEVNSKQFFEDYTNVNGLAFPKKITHFLYTKIGNEIKITTFENIIVNNYTSEKFYNYSINNK